MPAAGDGADWLDEAAAGKHHWTKVGPTGLDAELAPGLPCRAGLGFREGRPVLYPAIGINGTPITGSGLPSIGKPGNRCPKKKP